MNIPVRKIAGVCGWPIHHSLSPMLHQFWLSKMKINGGYIPFAVHPDEAIAAFQSLKKMTISGVNVTAPLKKHAYDAADIHTVQAKSLGVANCLYKRGEKLVAHNTDIEGFLAPLRARAQDHFFKTNPAIIFGAGGAARATVGALLNMGVPEIRVCTRRDEQSEQMVSKVNLPNLYMVPWAKRQTGLKTSGLIVNATTAGMHGRRALDISLKNSRPDAVIYDLVYTPIKTPLIKDAEKHQRSYLGGLDMLIAQARPSFELFFGSVPADEFDPAPLLLQHLEDPHSS